MIAAPGRDFVRKMWRSEQPGSRAQQQGGAATRRDFRKSNPMYKPDEMKPGLRQKVSRKRAKFYNVRTGMSRVERNG